MNAGQCLYCMFQLALGALKTPGIQVGSISGAHYYCPSGGQLDRRDGLPFGAFDGAIPKNCPVVILFRSQRPVARR